MTVCPNVTEMTTSRRVQSIECPLGHVQLRGQVYANGCSSSVTILDASTRNVQNNKDKYADQNAKKLAMPAHIHVLPLLSRSSWTKFISTNVCMKYVLCSGNREHYVISVLIF